MNINQVRDRIRALSNPEGINQYTKGGSGNLKFTGNAREFASPEFEKVMTNRSIALDKSHRAEARAKGARFTNYGHSQDIARSTHPSIGSKTTKGYLETTINSHTGKSSHVWSDM
jgi:hypothetical protein